MRLESSHILADTDIGKLVIGILVFVVWGIGSLASMVKKANEEAKRRAMSRPKVPIAPTDDRMVVGGFATTPVPRPPPFPAAMVRRGQQPRQQIRPATKVVPTSIRSAAAVAKQQAVVVPISSRPVVEKVASSAASNIARSNLAGAKAPAIRKWLVPATLRKQFILTELLRPPIALREEP